MAVSRWVGRAIGLDVHRDFCVVAICEDGQVRSGARVPSTPEGLTLLAQGLVPSDRVALEVTGSCWEVARILERTSIASWWSARMTRGSRGRARRPTGSTRARWLSCCGRASWSRCGCPMNAAACCGAGWHAASSWCIRALARQERDPRWLTGTRDGPPVRRSAGPSPVALRHGHVSHHVRGRRNDRRARGSPGGGGRTAQGVHASGAHFRDAERSRRYAGCRAAGGSPSRATARHGRLTHCRTACHEHSARRHCFHECSSGTGSDPRAAGRLLLVQSSNQRGHYTDACSLGVLDGLADDRSGLSAPGVVLERSDVLHACPLGRPGPSSVRSTASPY